jgi:hypothetical protein
MSTLPPGFSHEIPQHLSRPPPNEPRKDPLTGLPFVDLDKYCCGAHGLSILIVRPDPSGAEQGTDIFEENDCREYDVSSANGRRARRAVDRAERQGHGAGP